MIAPSFRLLLSLASIAACGLIAACFVAAPALARGAAAEVPAPTADLPEVGGHDLAAALTRLERAGFRTVRIEECTPERTSEIFESYGMRGTWTLGHVFQQSPKPGRSLRTDVVIMLRVCGQQDRLRTLLLDRAKATRTPVAPLPPPPPPERVPEEVPARDPVPGPKRDPAARTADLPRAEVPGVGLPDGDLPREDLPGDARAYASGSPEAPREAAVGQRGVVPTLLGLSLNDAEQLVHDADMRLHVDRVPGHPLGRVLEQAPSAGGRRPAGGVVRVVVTAGGDFDGEQAPIAPEVYLGKVVVPGLLDRTRLQAQRIITDLGLRAQEEEARRGLPGRVVDQMPPAGGRVPKGGIVRIWIGPGGPSSGPSDAPAPPPPAKAAEPPAEGPPAEPPRDSPREVPPPKPPLAPGTLPLGVPSPLAPGHGTVIPREEAVPIGFSWRGVKGAEAYILEIEEEAAEGRWLANARKPARKTAVILDVERLQSRGSGRLRWRVTAMSNGRAGTPSKWVLLK